MLTPQNCIFLGGFVHQLKEENAPIRIFSRQLGKQPPQLPKTATITAAAPNLPFTTTTTAPKLPPPATITTITPAVKHPPTARPLAPPTQVLPRPPPPVSTSTSTSFKPPANVKLSLPPRRQISPSPSPQEHSGPESISPLKRKPVAVQVVAPLPRSSLAGEPVQIEVQKQTREQMRGKPSAREEAPVLESVGGEVEADEWETRAEVWESRAEAAVALAGGAGERARSLASLGQERLESRRADAEEEELDLAFLSDVLHNMSTNPPLGGTVREVKGVVTQVVEKLGTNGGEAWSMAVVVNDSSAAVLADVGEQAIERLVGLSAAEANDLKTYGDKRAKLRGNKAVRRLQTMMRRLDLIFTLHFRKGQRPEITNITPLLDALKLKKNFNSR